MSVLSPLIRMATLGLVVLWCTAGPTAEVARAADKPNILFIMSDDHAAHAIGYLAPGRRGLFNVAIRTVAVDRLRGTAEYGVGGGIVWDSVAGDEFEECRTKAAAVLAAITMAEGLRPAGPASATMAPH